MGRSTDKRLDNLDLMKAFAIMAVVALHLNLWNSDFINRGNPYLIKYAIRLISEGVPIFFMVNGFLLLRKSSFDLNSHIKKMIKILLLLLIWAVILTVTGALLSHPSESLSLKQILMYIVNTKDHAQYTGALWYLQTLLGVYLIFPIIWYVYKEHFIIYQYFFIVLCFSTIGIKTLNHMGDLLAAVSGNDMGLFYGTVGFLNSFNPMQGGDGICLFYFCLGGMVEHYSQWVFCHRKMLSVMGILSWPVAVVLGYLISIFSHEQYNEAFNFGSVFMVLFVVGFFAFTIPYSRQGNFIKKYISVIGQNTLGIYLSHYVFIFIVNHFHEQTAFKESIIAYIIVFNCALIFTLILKRIPVLRYIVEL